MMLFYRLWYKVLNLCFILSGTVSSVTANVIADVSLKLKKYILCAYVYLSILIPILILELKKVEQQIPFCIYIVSQILSLT